MLNVQIINKSKHPLPAYATELSAGMDIRANLNEPISLAPMQRCLVPTGLYIALPEGFEAQVRPRSGLAIKKGITVLNPLERLMPITVVRFVLFSSTFLQKPSSSKMGRGLHKW